mgnify:CR=1 FL=1
MKPRKKELEIILSQLEKIKNPKPELEQWSTPPEIAAEVLLFAYERGDVRGKICADFGCGNGIFSIGLAILGARKVIAIDMDPDAIITAKQNKSMLEDALGTLPIEFIEADIRNIKIPCDTVVMNPPFGLEKQTRHADRYFLLKAFESATAVYSLHHSSEKSRKFLSRLAEENNFTYEYIKTFSFPLRAKFWFHRREVKYIRVDFLAFHRKN